MPSHFRQLSTLRPFTRLNSAVLSVTTVSPRESAWAAMSMSFGPIGVPPASSCARTRPYVAAARRAVRTDLRLRSAWSNGKGAGGDQGAAALHFF